ncbi:hypothetical protein PSN45_003501 [Yamadazyma tenuis]|uniref:Uncharacterized protein n=1 Tax=Candida tenuis (strain ATCC 10573 / BCRC 21748 / CBS 615 / JCM 9827 / NBRC 10315 / NRRL Y-1498 / VKM Y-70) TaxID=590646 RepID=G3AXX6_CANTC|nr:uncharacterized protein CANTEDRAFT_112577 [Yamadazyma tenuis ATCC 10573]XP_006684723.1 uncharacterized protein CANTEDRAFT_112577 [Yamadazyma tenuis ATCC 10573]EGV66148.1 hypothetical protein CANTEDRAFT_112577 [Yamadazyma tenuis ATCC 10573]EGV66149.1 hypothetical protein CANTEDRAFT_112577 [Yamadazyma tenuis ATCC 10573]WEJ95967.1 hypothetical protein PSN45_003501 [Yamadazyma tenuis]
MLGLNLVISSLLAASSVSALQCNGCRGCGKRSLEEEGPTGVYARWWFGNATPQKEHIRTSKREALFEVKHEANGGQYLKRPENAIGLIVFSDDKHAAVAGWDGADTDGPWQTYGEQGPNASRFHYLGDS